MNYKYWIKTIIIALLIYMVSILLTSFMGYLFTIPFQISFAIEPSFFLSYLYGQYIIHSSMKKGIQFQKKSKFKVYLYLWLLIVIILTIFNYIIY